MGRLAPHRWTCIGACLALYRQSETEGVLLMLGLGACVALTPLITRRAWAAIGSDGETSSR